MDVSFIKFIELFKNLQDCRCQTQTNKIQIEGIRNINFKVKSYFRLVYVCKGMRKEYYIIFTFSKMLFMLLWCIKQGYYLFTS